MHLEFITGGLQVPYTVILPPFHERKSVTLVPSDLAHLGNPFVIKPANTTGGGTGVVLNAATVEDVLAARQLHKNDKYLLQEFIVPKQLDGKRGWFRVYRAASWR
jgi:carbamoylphosphate synthase large subunit